MVLVLLSNVAALPFLQIIFRKITDVKREQERQRNEVALSIPDDHPVRKLFQRFRQQRDAQTPGESNAYSDHNCVQVEPQHHHHHRPDSNSYTQCQSVSPKQQENVSTVQSKVPCTGGGSLGTVATPQPFVCAEEAEKSCATEAGESLAKPPAENQLCPRVRGGAGGGGGFSSRAGARGWAKFRNAASAAPPPPAVDKEQQPQKEEEWPKGRQASEQVPAANKTQVSEELGGTNACNSTGEAGDEKSALHKTDSCDSGITKSDLRIDRAGDSRSSFERSPMERNLFEHCLMVDPLKQSFIQPASEHTLLQATLHEAKLELKGDIQILSGRLSVLESQVSEILRLLSIKRRLSLPPTSSPRPRAKNQDLVDASKAVAPEGDDGPF